MIGAGSSCNTGGEGKGREGKGRETVEEEEEEEGALLQLAPSLPRPASAS